MAAWPPGAYLATLAGSLEPGTRKHLQVKLHRDQVERGPSVQARQSISRQYEEEYHRYYGWPYYWQGGGLWGASNYPNATLPEKSLPKAVKVMGTSEITLEEGHLRSARSVTGYHLRASDGMVGHVCDFMFDVKNWAIGQLIIKTGHRLSGKEVALPIKHVDRISYDESAVFVSSPSAVVEQSLPPHLIAAKRAG